MGERTDRAVIINADDFGWSPGVTEGIVQAHRQGVVTSTTLMANMPDAPAAVARLADVPGLGVGVHLNASQGRPLSREGLALAGDDGVMNHTALGLILACCRRPKRIDAVEAEFEAQIRWVLDHGIVPTHLDSHRHTHAFTPIFTRVLELARRYNVRHVRRPGERLAGAGWPATSLRQRWTNRILNVFAALDARKASAAGRPVCPTRGTWGVAHTGRVDAAWLIRAAERLPPGVTEIMVHPGRPDAPDPDRPYTRLLPTRQAELDALCDPAVREAFERQGVRLIHYGQL